MPIKSDSPLRKVTLNLYEADCAAMEKLYGRGWSEKVRQLLHEHLVRKQHSAQHFDRYLNKGTFNGQ